MGVGEGGLAFEGGGDAADALGGFAVGAGAGEGAGGLLAEAHGVGGRGMGLDAAEGGAEVAVHQLVAPGHDDDLGGAEHHGGDAVAVAVDVHEQAVEGEGVGAGEEEVAGELAAHDAEFLLGGEVGQSVVEEFLARAREVRGDLEVGHGERAAEADGAGAFGVSEDVVGGGLRVGAVEGGEAALGERIDGAAAVLLGCPVDEFGGSRLHGVSFLLDRIFLDRIGWGVFFDRIDRIFQIDRIGWGGFLDRINRIFQIDRIGWARGYELSFDLERRRAEV